MEIEKDIKELQSWAEQDTDNRAIIVIARDKGETTLGISGTNGNLVQAMGGVLEKDEFREILNKAMLISLLCSKLGNLAEMLKKKKEEQQKEEGEKEEKE